MFDEIPDTLVPGALQRGLGWKPNTQNDAHGPAHKLFKASPYLLDQPDLRGVARDPNVNGYAIYQGGAGSCWAFSTTRTKQLYYGVRKIVAPLASPRFSYWNGRNEEFAGQPPVSDRKLADTGTEPRLGLRAENTLGFVSIDDCPYSDNPLIIEARPDDSVYDLAYSQTGFQYGSVDELGQQRIDHCATLVRQGLPPQFGMMVDKAFMNWNPSKGPISSIDENSIVGGHMLTPLFFDYANQLVVFENWWEQWGTLEGFGIMTFKLFGSSIISDVASFRWLPTLLRRGS